MRVTALVTFSVQVWCTYQRYGSYFKQSMLVVLFLFEILLVLNVISMLTFWIWISTTRHNKVDIKFKGVESLAVYTRISLALNLLLFYKILFVLKRVEI